MKKNEENQAGQNWSVNMHALKSGREKSYSSMGEAEWLLPSGCCLSLDRYIVIIKRKQISFELGLIQARSKDSV